MQLDYTKILEEIEKYEHVKEKENYYQLLHSCHETYMELEGHKGQKIKIGNNAEAPLNEKQYILKDFVFYKMRDGLHTMDFSITLIITTVDDKGEELSFSYDYINDISIDVLNSKTLNFYVRTRNRIFDHNTQMINRVLTRCDEEIKEEYINTQTYSTRRFSLYDE